MGGWVETIVAARELKTVAQQIKAADDATWKAFCVSQGLTAAQRALGCRPSGATKRLLERAEEGCTHKGGGGI